MDSRVAEEASRFDGRADSDLFPFEDRPVFLWKDRPFFVSKYGDSPHGIGGIESTKPIWAPRFVEEPVAQPANF